MSKQKSSKQEPKAAFRLASALTPAKTKAPSADSIHPLQQLQQTHGNQAVQRMLRAGTLQAKLKIGKPGDKYEQEADRVADKVMRMPDPKTTQKAPAASQMQNAPVQRVSDEPEEELQGKNLRRKAVEEEKEELQTKPLADQITPLVQPQADQEIEEDEDNLGQAKLLDDAPVQRQTGFKEEEDENDLNVAQPKAAPGRTPAVTPGVQAGINAMHGGGGQPLDPATRAFMEPRFGRDFGRVRVHTGSRAAETARAVNARAFTVGRDVVFGAGQYAPGSGQGRQLLAHELTHVVQRSDGRKGFLSMQGRSHGKRSRPVSRRVPFRPQTLPRRRYRKKLDSPDFNISLEKLIEAIKCFLPFSYTVHPTTNLARKVRTTTSGVKLVVTGKMLGLKLLNSKRIYKMLARKLGRWGPKVVGGLARAAGPAAIIALAADGLYCIYSTLQGTKYRNHAGNFLIQVAEWLTAAWQGGESVVQGLRNKLSKFLKTDPIRFINWLMSRLAGG